MRGTGRVVSVSPEKDFRAMTQGSTPDKLTRKGYGYPNSRAHAGLRESEERIYPISRTHNWLRMPNQFALIFITGYRRFVSPALPRVCRFTPTCSEYGFQAFQTYPFFKAMWLTVSRISRCHPFHRGGFDPLP